MQQHHQLMEYQAQAAPAPASVMAQPVTIAGMTGTRWLWVAAALGMFLVIRRKRRSRR